MTRVNLIPVDELADQHLIAEYREIPRLKSFAEKTEKTKKDIPAEYKLGVGHMIFFLDKAAFIENRHYLIVQECLRRGFKITYTEPLIMPRRVHPQLNYWVPSKSEVMISWRRIIEKLELKPGFYKWTIPQ